MDTKSFVTALDPNLIDQLLAPLILALFAVVFYALWHRERIFHSARLFAASYATAAFAFSVQAAYGVHDFINGITFIGDIAFVLSPAILVMAMGERFSFRPPIVVLFSLVFVASIGQGWFGLVDRDLAVRIYFINFGVCSIFLIAIIQLLSQNLSIATGLVAAQLAVVTFAVALSTIFAVDVTNSEFTVSELRETVYMALINITVSLISLTLAVTLLLHYIIELISFMRHQADTDPLTGLLNRRGLEAECDVFLNSDGSRPFAMIVLDIDYFKGINDRFGHAAGDAVLRKIASIVRNGVRNSDMCGRIGGEEFCIVMPDANASIARLCAETIRSVIEQTCCTSWPNLPPVTASFGISEYRDNEGYEALFRRADAALYEAKRTGRNKVVIDSVQKNPTSIKLVVNS